MTPQRPTKLRRRSRGRAEIALALAVTAALLLAAAPAWAGQGSNIAATRHNLTASGPGPIKTTQGGEVCRFCHTPHASNPVAPLWNRNDPGTYYQTYASTTLVAVVGQPNGSSRLCLSCHDGTIALGQTYNSLNNVNAVYLSAGNRGYLGTDLSDDHPISFVYDSTLAVRKGQMRDPAALPRAVKLDANGQLQCTTCHDVHDDTFGKFLVMANTESSLCISCHNVTGWTTASHAASSASLSGAHGDKWDNLSATTVRGAGCESCHRPHTAGGRQRLLRFEAEESNCLNCHDGSVARTDLAGLQSKTSAHDSSRYTRVHDPTENTASMSRHVECADCHNPHAATGTGAASAPNIKPAMAGAWGVTRTGQKVSPARYEYEVCYKCHSAQNFATPVVNRVLGNNNIADEFSSGNASFHPVELQGRNANVPSLLQPWTTASMVYCSDCHGTDDPGKAKGPHGSSYRPLLVANYSTLDNASESAQAYALCYKCHSRTNILGDASFKKHKTHIQDKKTPCSVCHDPHGVATNTHLINFDRNVVLPSSSGKLLWQDNGDRKGLCYLKCHNVNHNPKSY